MGLLLSLNFTVEDSLKLQKTNVFSSGSRVANKISGFNFRGKNDEMKARLLIALFALALIAAPQYAAADSITVNGATFTLTLLSNVGNTYNYQYHINSPGLNCPSCTILYAVA